MALSNAERQKRYRKRLSSIDDDALSRLTAIVSVATAAQFARLARHYGISKRELIEKLMVDAETAVQEGMSKKQLNEYFKPFE